MSDYTDAWTSYVKDEAIPGTIATPLDSSERQSLAEAVVVSAAIPGAPEFKSLNVDGVRSELHSAALANGYVLRDALIEDLRTRLSAAEATLADHEARIAALE